MLKNSPRFIVISLLLFLGGQHSSAIAIASTDNSAEPGQNKARLHNRQGMLLQTRGNLAEAAEEYREAIKICRKLLPITII